MAKELILVVDDEANIVSLLRYNLEQQGFEVICASDGNEAIALARREHPDLILLDVMLPDRSGIDVTRTIRKESKTPIIMVTAKVEEIDKVLGLEMGADDYVPKPFSPRELFVLVLINPYSLCSAGLMTMFPSHFRLVNLLPALKLSCVALPIILKKKTKLLSISLALIW